jgi:DNA-binding IclR family transcriptional regulator
MSAAGINTHIIPANSIAALVAIADNGPSTVAEIVERAGINNNAAHNALRSLKYRKMIDNTKCGRTYTWHMTVKGSRQCDRLGV